jgi:phosphonate transport system substrate-binding protein
MFRGIFIVRKQRHPQRGRPQEQGRELPGQDRAGATMRSYLHERGCLSAPTRRVMSVAESSIMNVYLGSTPPAPLGAVVAFKKDHRDIGEQLEVRWTTEPLLNNSLVARDDFPPELLKKVADILFSLQTSNEGQEMLARIPLSHFEAANDATYRPVSEFVDKFSQTVRPLKSSR